MRITGGEARGRLISSPEGLKARPTASKVRQAFFNILDTKVNSCHFLDLFAGSGLMGIEALSRGAQRLVAVEEDRNMVKVLRTNLLQLGYEAEVISADVRKVIPTLEAKAWDIIFADPPYASNMGTTILDLINKHNLLNDDGLLIIEHAKHMGTEPEFGQLYLKDRRHYGQTSISFYQVKQAQT